MRGWKTNFAQMHKERAKLESETEQLADIDTSKNEVKPSNVTRVKQIREKKIQEWENHPFSTEEVRIIAIANNFINEYEHQAINIKRANSIKEVNQKRYFPKSNSLQSRIIEILSKEPKQEFHIVQLIDKLQDLNFKFNSRFHIYSQVYSCIHRNLFAFIKTKPATFRLREPFVIKQEQSFND